MRKGDGLDFDVVNQQALNIASLMQEKKAELLSVLTRYETYKTAEDELARSLDLLTSLHENKEYFKSVVGPIAVFMPSNQPLYSFSCFAIVPALMSERVCVKSPEIMAEFYEDMLAVLRIKEQPFTIEHTKLPHSQCVDLFTATTFAPDTNLEKPIFEAVIFTGTSKNADILRKKFHKSVLFIANGSGHNPLIVTETADIEKAVEAIMNVRTYNQGQDCASPNSILIHAKVYDNVLQKLRIAVSNLHIGPYSSPLTDIGPISRPQTLGSVKEFLTINHHYIDTTTDGVIRVRSNIVEPTIITKPLSDGPNFEEIFAPLFIIQIYDADQDLSIYFEDKRYANYAMYITVFGKSDYVEQFVHHHPIGSTLHDSSTVLYNTDLHKPGVERGVLPYGGYGRGASCVSKDGNIISKPTLPQREIFEYLVENKTIKSLKENRHNKSQIAPPHLSAKPTDKSVPITQNALLQLYPQEILKWLLYAKNTSEKLFTSSMVQDINKYYDEFDAVLKSLQDGSISDVDRLALSLSGIHSPSKGLAISFRQLLDLGQSVHWDEQKLEKLIKIKELTYSAQSIKIRLPRVKYWLENCKPELIISLRKHRDTKYMHAMSTEELQQVTYLHNFLAQNIGQKLSLTKLEAKLYNIAKAKSSSKIDTVKAQQKFFKVLYNLLIASETGPRLSTFIWAAKQNSVLKLLDTEGI